MSTSSHKKNTPEHIRVAVISVSTTRSLEQDESGAWIKKQAKKEGHEVVIHQVVTDDITAIKEMTLHVTGKIGPDAIIMSGGTGISPKDVTIEAVKPLFEKELTAFGPLFAQLSFEEIDSAAILFQGHGRDHRKNPRLLHAGQHQSLQTGLQCPDLS